VAAQQSTDDSWYRAKVMQIITDDYDESKIQVDVEIVDFGDCERKSLASLCQLKEDFLKLNFQAISVSMADIKPSK
jgi:hypothetical protein